ncbi:Cysteine proteinase inhibitor 6 [Ananas comosus]|uniref:Cysteine proteinase inhibitor n=1 Tax=Ananas comosus TaxID=4615 RepID=A0A199V006_ANACO|nr:Cysteine proteinase inhibitor 6 [Ananas comosus]
MGERLLQPVGDVREVGLGSHNTLAKEDLARFALQHHNNNNNNNALLEFVRVVKAKEQVVSGMMHYLTVEVNDAGKKKLYEAKVITVDELRPYNILQWSSCIINKL